MLTRSFRSVFRPFSATPSSPLIFQQIRANSTFLTTRLNQKTSPEDRKFLTEFLKDNKEKEGSGFLLEYGGLISHDIFWGDMDTFSHVNNVMYLKWFESGKLLEFQQEKKMQKRRMIEKTIEKLML